MHHSPLHSTGILQKVAKRKLTSLNLPKYINACTMLMILSINKKFVIPKELLIKVTWNLPLPFCCSNCKPTGDTSNFI